MPCGHRARFHGWGEKRATCLGVTPVQGRLHALHNKPQVPASGSQLGSGHATDTAQPAISGISKAQPQSASCSQRHLLRCVTALIAVLHCRPFLPHSLKSHPFTARSWTKFGEFHPLKIFLNLMGVHFFKRRAAKALLRNHRVSQDVICMAVSSPQWVVNAPTGAFTHLTLSSMSVLNMGNNDGRQARCII